MTARQLESVSSLAEYYLRIRQVSERLAAPFSEADQTVQSMADASPVKWHLAHTSWFFETFLLKPLLPDYQPFNAQFEFLFNSYYNAIGEQYVRANRGLITRPGKDDVLEYRAYVDEAMQRLLQVDKPRLTELTILGLAHEQQHQELLVTDIQHAFSFNPLHPKVTSPPALFKTAEPLGWHSFSEGIYEIGHDQTGFCFDNETPRHKHYLHPFKIADRLVTNEEYLQFIKDGGYQNPLLWLSEGWAWKMRDGICAPLYWINEQGTWFQLSLAGKQLLDMNAPVRHISYFEAAAYAAWAGVRLPTEFEWEVAASLNPTCPDRINPDCLQPEPEKDHQGPLHQLFNTLWQWTASQYLPYPGFSIAEGAVGEYNGKFMSNQFVLRGGSAVTPTGHIRSTYRNFFPATARWQYTGIRMAKND